LARLGGDFNWQLNIIYFMRNIRLKEAIIKEGRSEKWIAKNAGIADVTMYAYVTGARTPNVNIALKIAELLNTTVDKIFDIKK